MPITDTDVRRLTVADAALLAAVVAHLVAVLTGATPQAHHPAPGRFLHVVAVLGAAAALVAVRRRRPGAVWATLVAGAGCAAGIVVLHVVPLSPVWTNSYWGGVNALQWTSVALVVVTGVGAVWAALATRSSRSGTGAVPAGRPASGSTAAPSR